MLDRADVPLAPLTTLRLGGPARRLVTAYDEPSVVDVVRRADEAGEPAARARRRQQRRAARRGLRRHRRARRGARPVGRAATATACCSPPPPARTGSRSSRSASPTGSSASRRCPASPGLVGASAGAEHRRLRPGRLADRRRACGRTTGPPARSSTLTGEDCGFAYRHSAFKAEPDRWVVLAVTFDLGDRRAVGAGRLRRAGPARSASRSAQRAPLSEVREAVLRPAPRQGDGARRRRPRHPQRRVVLHQPAADRRAGAGAARARHRALRRRVQPPEWAEPDGRTKVSAAWLIERSGFGKGALRRAGRHLDQAHPRAGQPRRRDARRTCCGSPRAVRDGVREAFGVELVPEPVLVAPACALRAARQVVAHARSIGRTRRHAAIWSVLAGVSVDRVHEVHDRARDGPARTPT